MRPCKLIGQRFGKLTVVSRNGLDATRKNAVWNCLCDCGNTTSVSTSHLKSGHTKSCGCLGTVTENNILTRLQPTHGLSRTRLYRILSSMKQRCNNPKATKYHLWGGRGIKVCEEWSKDVQAFYDWAMSHGYRDGLTIDRIDNDKGYEPDNCRWVTISEQNKNRRCVKNHE